MKVTLMGIGCGAKEGMTLQAVTALEEADMVIGAERMLAMLPPHPGRDHPAYRAEEILTCILNDEGERCCVVYSGDPGFYSGAERLLPLLREHDVSVQVLPGLSSIQGFAARLGRSWKDWTLCSAHGTEPDLLALLRRGKPVFLLTGRGEDPARFCGQLVEVGLSDTAVTIGEDLSYPTERITRGTAQSLKDQFFSPLNVMLIEAPPNAVRRSPGLPDEVYIRGDVPMTKQEIRAVILAKLGVTEADLCWDIGAGTGSVSVELALQSRAVWAVERDETACGLIRQNREKLGVWNLRLLQGSAPEILERLPTPDKVFIGGSGGSLRDCIRIAAERNPDVRLCVSAVTLDTLHGAVEEMEALGWEPDVTQVAVTRGRKLGKRHILAPLTPVFLITGGGKWDG